MFVYWTTSIQIQTESLTYWNQPVKYPSGVYGCNSELPESEVNRACANSPEPKDINLPS